MPEKTEITYVNIVRFEPSRFLESRITDFVDTKTAHILMLNNTVIYKYIPITLLM